MIYCCVSPDKFEGDKATKLMQVDDFMFAYWIWKLISLCFHISSIDDVLAILKYYFHELMMIFVMLLQLAKLSEADMQSVINMKLIEATDSRKTSQGTFSLKFDSAKVNIYSKLKHEDATIYRTGVLV